MSALSDAVKDYLAMRRALGFSLYEVGLRLTEFAAFVESEGANFVSTELALRWATQPERTSGAYQARRLGMVRQFAEYYSAYDVRTEIPPPGLLPHRYIRKAPYHYSDTQIAQLLCAAQKLPSPKGLRAATYTTLLGLLVVTGMRISEPVALDRESVDLVRGAVSIRGTKFGKSRWLPLHQSTRDALVQYAEQRNRVHRSAVTPSFFLSEKGTRLTVWAVRYTFVKLSRQIGLRDQDARSGPRVHDLRHRFAIQTLLNWYRAGLDVEQRLPQLAAYLGHAHVSDTYYYLSATPELLRLAAKRAEQSAEVKS